MAQLTSITLDDGTVIYLEASDDLTDLPAPSTESTEDQCYQDGTLMLVWQSRELAFQHLQLVETGV
jgi:hypothetical protein